MDDRAYPHDLAAERSVLGAILVDNALGSVALGIAEPRHFYRDGHKRMAAACLRLLDAKRAIDPVSLADALTAAGDLEAVGGMAEIARLGDGIPRAANVEGYARIIRQKAELRDLIAAARATLDDAFEADDTDEVFERAESRLLSISRDTARGEFTLAEDWMRGALRSIERNTIDRRMVTGIPSGLARLDAMTRGWQPGHLVLIGARTGIGKTALMLQFALEASQHTMAVVLSLEMTCEELGYRAVSLESQVDAYRLQTGDLAAHESRAVMHAAERISERRLAIKDPSRQSLHGLCADVRRMASRYGLGIVFIDYLGLIEGPKSESRVQEVSAISRRLKGLAMELRIPVIALAQLSREAVKGNERPQLHHLKESGSLEQDANVVLLLHRPKAGEDGYRDGEEAELLVAKNRGGRTGKVPVQWRASVTRFSEIAEEPATATEQRAFL